MSTNEPPAGTPGEPTPPPPAAPDAGSTPPPPPPPTASQPAPPPPAAAPVQGIPRPGELMDRFLARLIDFVILIIPTGIIYAVMSAIFLDGFSNSVAEYLLFYLFYSIISVAIQLGYFAYFESSRGQTIGKQVMKLKTFAPDGVSNPTMDQALRRNGWLALGLVSIIPIVGPVIGGLASLAAVILIAVNINGDPVKRQHWFDKFAGGTQVMKIG
jgi:uncharacterized RDD family membrane protein YckC